MRRKSLLSDAMLSTVGVLAQGLSRFAYTAIVGRLLGPPELAFVNSAFALAILLSLLWPTALGSVSSALLRPEDTRLRRRLSRSLLVSLLVVALVAAIVSVALSLSPSQCVLIALLTIAWSSYIAVRGAWIGIGQMRNVALWDLLSSGATIGLLFAMVILGANELAVAPAIVGYLLFAVVGCRAVILATRVRPPSVDEVQKHAAPTKLIAWTSVTMLATNGIMQVPMVVASAFSDPHSAGQFAAALSLATPIGMLAQALTQALLPRFGELALQPKRAQAAFLWRSLGIVGGLVSAGCIVIAACLPIALPLIFGPSFDKAVPIAQMLIVAVLGNSTAVLLGAALSILRHEVAVTAITAGGSTVGVGLMVAIAVGLDGVSGALVGAIAGTALTALGLLVYSVMAMRERGHAASLD